MWIILLTITFAFTGTLSHATFTGTLYHATFTGTLYHATFKYFLFIPLRYAM